MDNVKYSIIPKPQRYISKEGAFTVTSNTPVLCVPEYVKAGKVISNYLKTSDSASSENAIRFNKDAHIPSEGYTLVIDNNGVTVTASDYKGAFYGAMTLKTVIMQSKTAGGKAVLKGLDIYDYPRFSYRGVMLDSSRHWFPAEDVKKLLEQMAFLKLNRFHWHLSDDQGYRIESTVFPELNSIGSKRQYEHLSCKYPPMSAVCKNAGGEYYHYYTKDEIRDIVKFAASLNIDIVPEIDIPGHTSDIIASYPELSCNSEGCEVTSACGIHANALCPGNEKVYDFLDKLFDEICELFPYKYFHLGGDEAQRAYKRWENDCNLCKEDMKKNGIDNGKDYQSLFMNRVKDILKKKNKTCIAWNDGFSLLTDKDFVCQIWNHANPLWVNKESAQRDFILSPVANFYFDMTYAHISLKKAYKFSEGRLGFRNDNSILGLECELWSEWITDNDELEFSAYPRIFALSECAWTKDRYKNYKDFYKRLDFYKLYMDSKNINYSMLEKRKPGIRNRFVYHLGKLGNEYKYSEKMRNTKE